MSLVCDSCSAPAVVVSPGSAEIRDLFLIVREVPMRRYCLACWSRLWRRAEAAA